MDMNDEPDERVSHEEHHHRTMSCYFVSSESVHSAAVDFYCKWQQESDRRTFLPIVHGVLLLTFRFLHMAFYRVQTQSFVQNADTY